MPDKAAAVNGAKADAVPAGKHSDKKATEKTATKKGAETETVVRDSKISDGPKSESSKEKKASSDTEKESTVTDAASNGEKTTPSTEAGASADQSSTIASETTETAAAAVSAVSAALDNAASSDPQPSTGENSVIEVLDPSAGDGEHLVETVVTTVHPDTAQEHIEQLSEIVIVDGPQVVEVPESKIIMDLTTVKEAEKAPEKDDISEAKSESAETAAVAEKVAETLPTKDATETLVRDTVQEPAEEAAPKPDRGEPASETIVADTSVAESPAATETVVADEEQKSAPSVVQETSQVPGAEKAPEPEKSETVVTDSPKTPTSTNAPVAVELPKTNESTPAVQAGTPKQTLPAQVPATQSVPAAQTSPAKPTPPPAKGPTAFKGAEPVGAKSLPPWLAGKDDAEPLTAASAGPVQMVGSHEDTVEQVQESQQEYKKQFSDRKKFFKQQMEDTGTVPIKVAPPTASYRDKAPVAEPAPSTPVVLSAVQAPPQFRLPTQPTPPAAAPQPVHGYVPPVSASLNNSLPGPKAALGVHPSYQHPGLPNGVRGVGASYDGSSPSAAGAQRLNDSLVLLSPQQGAPTPFPSPASATPSSAIPAWTPPVHPSGPLSTPNFSNLPSFNSGQNHPGYSPSGNTGSIQTNTSFPSLTNSTGSHAPLPDLTDLIGMAPLDKKKHFADSSFYSDRNELFPTFEEQVRLCQEISQSLTSEDNKQSLGARMFTRRKQSSRKWIAKAGENGIQAHNQWQSDDEGAENDEDHRKPAGPPPMKYYKSPKGVDDAQSLMQKDPEVRIFDQISPNTIAAVAQGLQDTSGKGVDLFQKRKMKSEEWVVDETNVQKPPPPPVVELTKGNKLQQILNSPAVLYVQSPWEAAMSSPIGSCENAFKDVRRGDLDNAPPAPLSRTASPMFGPPSPQPTFNHQASPISSSPAPPPSDAFSRLPRGWGAGSQPAFAPKPYEPAPFTEAPRSFAPQPPSPSPKPAPAPMFKPSTPEPIQNYKPFVPTPIYKPPSPQVAAPQPQFNAYQPPQQQYDPPPVQQHYQPPPVQQQPQYSFPPAQQPFMLQEPAKRAPAGYPQEQVNTVHRAGPPDIGGLYNSTNADVQIDAEVPNYQPAPHTVVRRYSQQFDNYSPQYSHQQPQYNPSQNYQQQQGQGYPSYGGQQQQNYYGQQQQPQKSVTWNPDLKQTQHYAPQSTNEHKRLYDERHKQWERPPEPMSARIRPRSRSQPPAQYGGRQGYSPSLPSPSYGGYGTSSPTPKWGGDMHNWARPPSSPVYTPVQQVRRQSQGTWGSDMRNWTPKEVSQPQQPTYRPVQQQQRLQQQSGTWGNDMSNWRPRYAPQQVTQQYRPSAAPQSPPQGRWGSDMHNWGANTTQQAPRFPSAQQQPSSGYSSSPAGYATLPSRSRQGQFQQQQPQQQYQQPQNQHPVTPQWQTLPAQPHQQRVPAAQLPYQQNFNQPSCGTLPRIQAGAAPWNVGRASGGLLVSDM